MLIKMKYFALFALAAVGLAFTSQADVVEDIKNLLVPEGVAEFYEVKNAEDQVDDGAFAYIEPESGDTVVVFASVGEHSFKVIPGISKLDYLVVAGGGAGGEAGNAGGGGAGGMLTNTTPYAVSAGKVLSVTVGQGGAAYIGNAKVSGGKGGKSSLDAIEAEGGGGGAPDTVAGNAGGSGGGAGGGAGYALSGAGNGGSGVVILRYKVRGGMVLMIY